MGTARRCTSTSVALLVVLAGCGSTTSRAVRYRDVTSSVGPLQFTRITRDVYRSWPALRSVLARNNPSVALRKPAVDFTHEEAYLVAAGPRSSTGYELRIASVRDTGGRVVVTVHERTPSLGEPVRARVTYPFRLLALPRSDEPVKLKWPGRP